VWSHVIRIPWAVARQCVTQAHSYDRGRVVRSRGRRWRFCLSTTAAAASVCDGRTRRPVSPTRGGFVSILERECGEGPVWLVIKKIDARARTHFHYRSWFLMRRVATLRANLTKRSSIVRYPPSLTLSASLSSDFLSANHMYFKRFLHCSIVKMCSL